MLYPPSYHAIRPSRYPAGTAPAPSDHMSTLQMASGPSYILSLAIAHALDSSTLRAYERKSHREPRIMESCLSESVQHRWGQQGKIIAQVPLTKYSQKRMRLTSQRRLNRSQGISQCWCCGGDYAFKISRRDSTRSIKGRMPSSLEMAKDSSSMVVAFSRSPGLPRCSRVSA